MTSTSEDRFTEMESQNSVFEQEVSNAENHSVMVFDEPSQILAVMPLFKTSHRQLRVFRLIELSSGSQLRSGPLFRTGLSNKQQQKNEQ